MYVIIPRHRFSFFFFFNDTATTEIYTLSLHDALPISVVRIGRRLHQDRPHRHLLLPLAGLFRRRELVFEPTDFGQQRRSEEHTSELQSQSNLVCRLLLEKKKKNTLKTIISSIAQ